MFFLPPSLMCAHFAASLDRGSGSRSTYAGREAFALAGGVLKRAGAASHRLAVLQFRLWSAAVARHTVLTTF